MQALMAHGACLVTFGIHLVVHTFPLSWLCLASAHTIA
jgi:hypothetical protein